jgi:DNA-binding response OmpR family regulator
MTSAILILLVEDEPVLLDIVRTTLEDGGYDVVVAENGSSAIRALDERPSDFVALVTDIRIGKGPSGWDVARHARALKPEVSIVYMTGDSAGEWAVHGVPKSLLLQKPFAQAQLITAVSTLLNEASIISG